MSKRPQLMVAALKVWLNRMEKRRNESTTRGDLEQWFAGNQARLSNPIRKLSLVEPIRFI